MILLCGSGALHNLQQLERLARIALYRGAILRLERVSVGQLLVLLIYLILVMLILAVSR